MESPSRRLWLYIVVFYLIEHCTSRPETIATRPNNNGKKSSVSNYTGVNVVEDNTAGSFSLLESVTLFKEAETVEVTRNKTVSEYQLDVSKPNRHLALEVENFVCYNKSVCNESLSEFTRGLCTFECMPCQCDGECGFYGDCCSDTAFRDSPDKATESNPYLICTTQEWTTWDNSSSIFMVGKCPLNSETTIAQKCEFPDITNQQEATPVSIVDSNSIYQNMFCAECHQVKDYEIWRHEVTCSISSYIQFATSKSDLWRIVVEDAACSIVTKPPDLVSVRDCYPVQYNTCNGSGNALKKPDPVVKRLCEMYSQPVHYYGTSDFFSSYRNVFCAMCDGAVLDSEMPCGRTGAPHVPFPLNFLLDFNPPSERIVQETVCDIGQVVDPFSRACVNISCPIRRSLVDNHCEHIFSTASNLGMAFDVILTMVDNRSVGVTNKEFLGQFSSMLKESLEPYSPFAVSRIAASFYTSDPRHLLPGPAELIAIQADVISITKRSLEELESTLLNLMKDNFIYQTAENTSIRFQSTPNLCLAARGIPQKYEEVELLREEATPEVLDPVCADIIGCLEIIEKFIYFQTVPLNCPFLEYNLTQVNFTYFSDNHSILFREHLIDLVPLRHFECNGLLQICTDELVNISKILRLWKIPETNLALSIVSLVCMSLSLAGLFLTFTIYSLIAKLRTLPGKNTMALVLNLFLAQLISLTTSNRTSNSVNCTIFGVLIHYFWLSAFASMAVSAYHMHTVFTVVIPNTNSRGDIKGFIRYALISNLSPIPIILVCLAVFLSQSNGLNSGYGGRVCFLDSHIAIGGFFAAPLGLMLLLNTFFFVRTIHAIRSVPDMKTSTNQNNKHYTFVYIRLSVLFGFTWTFGILAEILSSEVLNYIFVVLSGSQGLLLFIAFCLNKRILSQLKVPNCLGRKHKSSNLNPYPPTISTAAR